MRDDYRFDYRKAKLNRYMDLPRVFGRNVKRYRRQKGWSMADLGRRLEVSAPYISNVENQGTNCTLRQCERFALALGVPVKALFE